MWNGVCVMGEFSSVASGAGMLGVYTCGVFTRHPLSEQQVEEDGHVSTSLAKLSKVVSCDSLFAEGTRVWQDRLMTF